MIQNKKVGFKVEMQHWLIWSNENDPKYFYTFFTKWSFHHVPRRYWPSAAALCNLPMPQWFFCYFFFLLPKAFWADINLARPVKSLPAVFHSHHFCSWGGTHWFMGVRYQSTQQTCFRDWLHTSEASVSSDTPCDTGLSPLPQGVASVLCYKPGLARKAGMCCLNGSILKYTGSGAAGTWDQVRGQAALRSGAGGFQ